MNLEEVEKSITKDIDLLNKETGRLNDGWKKLRPIERILLVHTCFNELGIINREILDFGNTCLSEFPPVPNYLNDNWKVYNVTGGGQYDKKADIGERQQTKLKSYKNGKNLGYEKAREEVKIYFDKYLDYNIKGKSNKIKERKLLEFKDWLEVQSGEDKDN